MDTSLLNEQRCRCGKLLLKGIFFDGTLEIKCKKCGIINKIGNIKITEEKDNYVLIFNDKGIVANACDSACNVLGYKRDELIGKHFDSINPIIPNEIKRKFFGLGSVLSKDNNFQLDTFNRLKNGEDIPVILLLKLYQPSEKGKYILASARLKDSVNNETESSKKDVNFLDNACDFFFDIDKNGIIYYISPSVEKFFCFSQETVFGKNYFDCVPFGKRKESKIIFEHFSKDRKPFRIEDTACLSTNGKTMHSELFFTPNYNDMGKFIGYSVLVWTTRQF